MEPLAVPLSKTEIESRLAALEKAVHSGVLKVRHGEEETVFRSLDEINSIIASLKAQLAALAGTKRKRLFYPRQDSKGY